MELRKAVSVDPEFTDTLKNQEGTTSLLIRSQGYGSELVRSKPIIYRSPNPESVDFGGYLRATIDGHNSMKKSIFRE